MRISADGKTITVDINGDNVAQGKISVCAHTVENMIAQHKRTMQNLYALRNGTRIERAKAVREITGCGLREAVQIVDNLLGYST